MHPMVLQLYIIMLTFVISAQNIRIARKHKDAMVAFDGYENINVKYMVHQRQFKKKGWCSCHASIIIFMN